MDKIKVKRIIAREWIYFAIYFFIGNFVLIFLIPFWLGFMFRLGWIGHSIGEAYLSFTDSLEAIFTFTGFLFIPYLIFNFIRSIKWALNTVKKDTSKL
jgi:hypothetical protein